MSNLDGYTFNVSIRDNCYFDNLEEAEKVIKSLIELGFCGSNIDLKLEPLYGDKADLFGMRF